MIKIIVLAVTINHSVSFFLWRFHDPAGYQIDLNFV